MKIYVINIQLFISLRFLEIPLIKNSDWIGIYKMFEPINNIRTKPDLWNDEDLLSHISFATAKLSEVYINLKQNFPIDNDRNKFLAQQKKYREATEFLKTKMH